MSEKSTPPQSDTDYTQRKRENRDAKAEYTRRWQGTLDEPTAEVLTRIYVARRLDYQLSYYKAKMLEYERSSDRAFRLGALIMSITSLLAALGTQNNEASAGLRLLTAILPALAALVASFRQLYQWDRQAQLFRDTILGLQRASLTLPDLDQVDTTTAARVFPSLVKEAETVFEDEVNQWGQIALGDTEQKEGEDSLIAFARDYGIDIYTEDGKVDPDKLASVKDILTVSRSRSRVQAANLTIERPAMATGEVRPVQDDAADETPAPENPPPKPDTKDTPDQA